MPWPALALVAASLAATMAAGGSSRGQTTVGDEPVTPVPAPQVLDPAKLALGERLFRDARLSRGEDMACVSCHALARGGDDERVRPTGADGRPLDFNAPTIFNATLNFRLNWRGNFRSLEEQNEAVLLDPRLMGITWEEVLARLRADGAYLDAFRALYGGLPERRHVLDALAAFQRSLLTPDARFDRYLRGQSAAITPEEERGYRLFKAYGCIACHQGVNIGGNLFQKFGVFDDPLARRGGPVKADLGRFTLTGLERDRYVFRVPSLRNVALTSPYFHDGSESSLAGAVAIMARSQLGRRLAEDEVDAIVNFLMTLTGEYRGRPLAGDRGRAP